MSSKDFYRAFEDVYRGSRELIRDRLKVYTPFIQPLLTLQTKPVALDLGCGRGEWLELLSQIGFEAHGIDLDSGMLAACSALGLAAQQGDAVAHLATLPDESMAVISAFHVVEHISFEQLQIIVSESHRVLKPGGILIMETPNPENIIVATQKFYLDPTHLRPIPPSLLSFIPEHHGYKRVKTLRLQEDPNIRDRTDISLMEVLDCASPDYAIVAQKKAAPEVLSKFDVAFSTTFGIELQQLTDCYDKKFNRMFYGIEKRLDVAEAQTRSIAQDALARISTLQDNLLDSSVKLAQIEAAKKEANSKIYELQDSLQSALEQLAQSEARKNALDIRTIQLEDPLHSTSQELHGIHQANHHHWLLTQAQQQQLEAMHRSMSWRITAPLRVVANVLMQPGKLLRNGINFSIRYAIDKGQRPLSLLMSYVLRNPQLSYRINCWLLHHYPSLHGQLLTVARQQKITSTGYNNTLVSEQSSQDLESMPFRAKKLYSELQIAIKNKKEEE